jgi:hypothetical protein
MKLGVRLRARMSGAYYLFADPLEERALAIELEIRLPLARRLLLERTADVTGKVTLERLALDRPLGGTVRFLFDQNRMPYDLVFTADEGRTLRLRGQHDFMVMDAVGSLTTVPASLYDATGDEIGRATLRFDWRSDLGRTLKSIRPVWRAAATNLGES